MARPTKLTQSITAIDPETGQEVEITVGEAIVQALKMGAYVEDAAEAAGVADSTVFSWIARGQEHDGAEKIPERERPYVEFSVAVERARAGSVVFNLSLIRRAALEGTWTAAAWWLERTRPEQFGRRIVEARHSGSVARPEGLDLSTLSDDEVDRLEELMAKASPNGATADGDGD